MPSAPSAPHGEVASLYADHQQWLQRWLRRKVGNAFDAADLSQDTFCRLLTAPQAEVGLRAPHWPGEVMAKGARFGVWVLGGSVTADASLDAALKRLVGGLGAA